MFPELRVMEVILQSLGMLPSQIRIRFYIYSNKFCDLIAEMFSYIDGVYWKEQQIE